MPSSLPEDVRLALANGQKIEAIRLLRERTGFGLRLCEAKTSSLAEAKAAVESGMVPSPVGDEVPVNSLPAEVTAALASGRTIEAIRLLRQARGIGLKEAKAIVDAARNGPARTGPPRMSGLAPGEVPRNRLSAGLLVVVLLVVAAVAWQLLHKA